MSTFTMHLRVNGRITARAAQVTYLDREVKNGNRIVGVVTKAQPVDGGRAVRLTVERTNELPIANPAKLTLGKLRE